MCDFVTDDEGSYDYDDFKYEEETSEDISPSGSQQSWRSEASESDLDIIDAFPITAHRQKYIIRYNEFEYY